MIIGLIVIFVIITLTLISLLYVVQMQISSRISLSTLNKMIV